jgi:two-component system cell cycle sensor histidine kinase/response regulator CckA
VGLTRRIARALASHARRSEAQLGKFDARLLRSQRLEILGRIASAVAHDLNNHLTAIRISSELLAMRFASDADARQILVGIDEATELSEDLIRRLLAFGRRPALDLRVLDLGELVIGIEPLLARILPENVDLKTVHAAEPSPARADPAWVEAALLHLVLNARDALPEGGGTITIETGSASLGPDDVKTHPPLAPGRFVFLSIVASGAGPLEPGRSAVVEPFSGVGSTGVDPSAGLVAEAGGAVVVVDEPPGGLRVYLPRAEPENLPEPVERIGSRPGGAAGTILLVEDDERVRRATARLLHGEGYRVLEAADGGQALALAEREGANLDLLVTDVVVPGMGGIPLAERVRDVRPDLPVLFVSGYDESSLLAVDPSSGVDLLRKPFTGGILLDRVRRLLDLG